MAPLRLERAVGLEPSTVDVNWGFRPMLELDGIC